MRTTRSIGMRAADTVLVIEDSLVSAEMMTHLLLTLPAKVCTAATLREARDFLATPQAENLMAILLDLRLPDGDGMELLREVRAARLDVAVVVITAYGSISVAVDAMREGADDFLVKPIAPARLLTTVRNATEKHQLVRLVRPVSPGLSEDRFEGFIGADLSMQAVYRMIEQAARSKATVFITGESGTGKEVCAEAIHRRSDRRNSPFVAINCGAIPKDLMESEIFGHVRGAFTGATTDRDGAAMQADGGMLFLDEVCELDLSLQTKLLRYLQTGIVQRVGSDKTAKVDTRIVCATNRDPFAEVQGGRFREDLYYRLYVVPIHLPPLHERGTDVIRIARHFLTAFAEEEGRHFIRFDTEVEEVIGLYRWPGNVRELQNVIRNIVVLNDGDNVTLDMVPARLIDAVGLQDSFEAAEATVIPPARTGRSNIRSKGDVEREMIESAVLACDGNMTAAAQQLGISVKTIYRKRQAWAAAAG